MRTYWGLPGRSPVALGTAVACLVVLLPAVPVLLRAPAGLWLLFAAPSLLLFGLASRVVSTKDGAALLAVGLAVLGDLLLGLAVNTVLPLLGVAHPLERLPLTLSWGPALVLLSLLAPGPQPPRPPAPGRTGASAIRSPRALVPVAGLGAVALVLSVAGPVRLNNGFGAGTSLAALCAVTALLLLLLAWSRRSPVGVLELGLFLAAAALLLTVSLRGWYITGHDIQSEFKVFTVALDDGRWRPGASVSSYNACLSVSVLPVLAVRLTGIPGLYVFKVLLPLLFALAPVLVFRSVRNVAPVLVALLSAVYFMAFPTFFTDMPYLARQEVAFLLLGCALVVVTDSGRPLTHRRTMLVLLTAGIVLSHYSTTYVLVGTLALAWAGERVWRQVERHSGRSGRAGGPADASGSIVTWWLVAATLAMALLWAGPITHSSSQARSTLARIIHPGRNPQGSSDTSYSIFHLTSVSANERLVQYRATSLEQSAQQRAVGKLLPLGLVDRYPTVAVSEQRLPLTALGRTLHSTGVDVARLNDVIRGGAARLLQVLLLVGLIVSIRARRTRPFRPTRDQLALALAAVGMLALLTMVSALSADYGVLRAFQQELFFFAPFTAAASLWLARWAGRWAAPLACGLALALFLDLTGVVPKALGGYPPQLLLDNSGQYYDLYYPHPAEFSAAQWAQTRIRQGDGNVGAHLQTDQFTFDRLQTAIDAPALQDIYPTLLEQDSYVLLGTSTVREDRATVFFQGDLLTYGYPLALLDSTKDKVYAGEGVEVYR